MQQDSFHRSLQHHFSNIAGLRLHYVTGGNGDPVLLLAGFPESSYAWRRVIPSFAEHYTVIAVDLPGQGDSGSRVVDESPKHRIVQHNSESTGRDNTGSLAGTTGVEEDRF